MTDNEVGTVKKGDRFIDREGVRWTATTDARLEGSGQNVMQAFLVSASGAQVMRLTFRNGHLLEHVR